MASAAPARTLSITEMPFVIPGLMQRRHLVATVTDTVAFKLPTPASALHAGHTR